MIPFKVVIPEDERDGDLPDKLRDELPGILNWAIEGAKKWYAGDLQPPEEVIAATAGYRAEMGSFDDFCADVIIEAPGNKLAKSQLYDAYLKWIAEEGGSEMSKKELTTRLKRQGYEEGRNNSARVWLDITTSGDTHPGGFEPTLVA